MKISEHVKCCFTFWRPSVSRRMTLYFVIFGLLVFLATTAAHMIAAKKHFLNSAVRIVEHQIVREQADLPPDIIWQSIGRERPELTTHDEIGELSRTFNQMIVGLRKREQTRLLEFELEKGRQIQQDFLPRQIPSLPDWEFATYLDPAGQVSGDFYDVFPLDQNRIGLVIADVCDKGVGSAFYMALFRSLIRIYAEQLSRYRPENRLAAAPPASASVPRVVQLTNDYITRNHGHDGMFATIFFGVLDPRTGQLEYVNAGHEPLYVVGRDGIRTPIDPTGPAVGLMPGTAYVPAFVELAHGEVLMGYTDGLTEARSPEGEFFSRSRLRSLLTTPPYSAGELLEEVKTSLFNFMGSAPRDDDVTLIAVQRAAS